MNRLPQAISLNNILPWHNILWYGILLVDNIFIGGIIYEGARVSTNYAKGCEVQGEIKQRGYYRTDTRNYIEGIHRRYNAKNQYNSFKKGGVNMKLGLIIKQGSEKEVREEYCNLLEKAKEGFNDLVCVYSNNSFKIKTNELEIIFTVDRYFRNEYAIYQIFN